MTGQKIYNFKLDAKTFENLTKQSSLHVECKTKGRLELVSSDTRIKLDAAKDAPNATATYYNNNSSTLHFLGDTVPATASVRKVEKRQKESVEQRDKVAKLLDIPSTANASSVPSPTKQSKSTSLKKTSSSSSSSKKKTSNIPPPTSSQSPSLSTTPSRGSTPLKTPKPSSSTKPFSPPIPKTNYPSEDKYSMKSRVLHRLALQPWSLIELTKSLNRTQQERCDQLDVKHIVDMVGIPIKKDDRKKFCLKPNLYKDIQIWTWPFYSSTEKQTVADNAKEAYDLLQAKGFEIDRSNLYHPNSPYKPTITSPMLTNDKKTLSPSSARKSHSQEKGKGRLTPVEHASPNTPISPSKLTSPQKMTKSNSNSSNSNLSQSSLKSSSVNKKYASKALPQQQNGTTVSEKLSPPTRKRKEMDVDVPSRDTLIMPVPRHKRKISDSTQSTTITPSATTPLPPPTPQQHQQPSIASTQPPAQKASKGLPKEPTSIKPVNIESQQMFNAYCHKYNKQHANYVQIKHFFKNNFPQYFQVLKSTAPPKGTKRSYYDLKTEYQSIVKANYLKKGDNEQSLKEAEEFLVDCNNKRRRLNYMWTSIKQNLDEHHYEIPKSLCK